MGSKAQQQEQLLVALPVEVLVRNVIKFIVGLSSHRNYESPLLAFCASKHLCLLIADDCKDRNLLLGNFPYVYMDYAGGCSLGDTEHC